MYLFKRSCFPPISKYSSYLHSTMYLFKHYRSRSDLQNYDIYIPLCIYLNHGSSSILERDFTIYIPLCIYLNGKEVMISLYTLRFTFHYVSI